MKLYLISQGENSGWDTYSEAVVCAKDENEARHTHPSTGRPMEKDDWATACYGSWSGKPERVAVCYLGNATKGVKRGVICHSFHAG